MLYCVPACSNISLFGFVCTCKMSHYFACTQGQAAGFSTGESLSTPEIGIFASRKLIKNISSGCYYVQYYQTFAHIKKPCLTHVLSALNVYCTLTNAVCSCVFLHAFVCTKVVQSVSVNLKCTMYHKRSPG